MERWREREGEQAFNHSKSPIKLPGDWIRIRGRSWSWRWPASYSNSGVCNHRTDFFEQESYHELVAAEEEEKEEEEKEEEEEEEEEEEDQK